MARPVKTALLCVPVFDEEAVDAVRHLLRTAVPGVIMMAERHIESRRYLIEEILRRWCDEDELDLIVTIGGTMPAAGPSSQEVVPEATTSVLERAMPGLSEAMRTYAGEETLLAALDRSVAGVRGRTLLVNLPAGAGAASLFLEAIVELLAPALAHVNAEPDAPSLADAAGAPAPERGQRNIGTQPQAAPRKENLEHRPSYALDADEFAEFLRRRSSGA